MWSYKPVPETFGTNLQIILFLIPEMQKGNLKKTGFLKISSNVQTLKGILLKKKKTPQPACYVHIKVLFGFVIQHYTKQTEDGGPGQKKPSAASAIHQHQKPNPNVEFLPELRTMKSQIALLKYFTHAHTLHLLNGANQKKGESTHYVGMGKWVGESSSSRRQKTLFKYR